MDELLTVNAVVGNAAHCAQRVAVTLRNIKTLLMSIFL